MTEAPDRHPHLSRAEGPPDRGDDPYRKLLADGVILLGTALDDEAANALTARLLHLEALGRDVQLCINSPGGSPSAMTAVYDTLRFVSCEVETVCLGQATGAAAVLLAAGTPGRRLALAGSRVVLRQPSLPEPVEGRADELAVHAQELLRLRTLVQDLLVRHTGQSPERVRQDLERATVLDARAAREYGLVDHVVADRTGAARGR